jgi:hypothetical protein
MVIDALHIAIPFGVSTLTLQICEQPTSVGGDGQTTKDCLALKNTTAWRWLGSNHIETSTAFT